ncbi:zinc finger protein CONSTANS-LIKE 15 [Dorcoceras hygrometricum]|uniref:Zinc finger protein CONSTANS-LIKE 15 n=1 Tax=Dorcoceras hygrometricum TaxID=472368 RepID=A0A2Z7CTL2_9LAMI|nr:zinc finger protein CONSTANS-LIKE 15 [Dorcoceras hygrometricum]
MASSLFTNTLHVCFDFVFAMDNPGLVSMFEALMASGLSGFLGCPTVLYEDALTEFFLNGSVRDGKVVSTIRGKQVEISEELFDTLHDSWVAQQSYMKDALTEFFLNGSVRDGKVVSTIRGKQVEISEELFANTFELPVDELTDLSEIPKDIVFDASNIFSFSGEQVRKVFDDGSYHLWSSNKLEQAAVQYSQGYGDCGIKASQGLCHQISLLLENVLNLELGDSSEFPSSRILTKKTVHRYVAINDKVGVEEVADVPRVKRTPVTKAVSRKRPAAVDEPIVKKKRTRVGKAAAVATDSALEAVPVQAVAPISTMPPPAPKRKIQKRKRRLALDSDVDIVGEPTTVSVEVSVENIVEEQRVEMPVDPVDQIVEQVIAETAQVETDVGRTNDSVPDVEDQGVKTADETELWFNLSYEEFATREANRPIETGKTATAAPTTDKNISDDESMTLEAILSTISNDLSLPSTFGKITPILFGKSISIPGVDEGDWYKASLPKINPIDKGKASLQERDPVKGNPVKEQFLLIVVDIDLLVQLREQVIDEVDRFFNSFSLKNLANLKIEDIYEKEGQVLSWAETDSTRISLQRKMYILTKYRELLLWKFLEIHLSNFVPGDATSVVDMKMGKAVLITVFEGPNRDRGAVIARSNTNIKSTCWIRTMLRINGTWVIEPYTLPPVSEFFKLLKKRWANVCIEAAAFFVSGKLLPVGSLNFCRAIAVVESAPVLSSQRLIVTSWGWSQLCTVFFRYSLFSRLLTVDFSISGSATVLIRPSLSPANIFDTGVQLPHISFSLASVSAPDVQLITSSVATNQNVQMDIYRHGDSPDSSADSSLHFNANVITTEDDAALDQFILPSSATDISASLAALRESFSKLVANQTRDSRKSGDAHSEVMSKNNHVERVFLDSLAAQNEDFRGLFKSIRQEAQNDNNALSLALKAVRTQNSILSTDLAATQKGVKDLKAALSKDFDDKLADIRNDLLEFRVETQEQLDSLGAHLAELIAFITKGSDDKKGEGSSSRPQPPPDDQNRPSGGSGSRADDPSRYGGGTVSR